MIDQRTAPYAAFLLRVTIAGLFAALYGKFILKPISLWWNGRTGTALRPRRP